MRMLACVSAMALLAGSTVEARAEQRLGAYARVVVPDAPLPCQKAAAEELAEYVGRICGKTLTVLPVSKHDPEAPGLSFFVGDAVAQKALGLDLRPWREEEWLLRSVPEGLLLAGHDEPGNPWSTAVASGAMLATYTLLEDHLGVHWFWPGPFGEHVPYRPDATVPELDVRAVPQFMIRSVQIGYGSRYHTKRFTEAARRWSRRNRLGWTRSAVFGHSWYYAFRLKSPESTPTASPSTASARTTRG